MRAKPLLVLLVVLACLALVVSAQAAASPGYHLAWLVPFSGGGATLQSVHYTADITIGQTVIGEAQSPGYHGLLGFWARVVDTAWRLLLPLITR